MHLNANFNAGCPSTRQAVGVGFLTLFPSQLVWGSTPGVPLESSPCSEHHNKHLPDTITLSLQVRGGERLPTPSHPLCGLSNRWERLVGPSARKVSLELGEVQRQLGQERKAGFLGMSALESIPPPKKMLGCPFFWLRSLFLCR